MPYSIELLMDETTNALVRSAWQKLGRVAGSDYMTANGVHPHVALSVFEASTDVVAVRCAQAAAVHFAPMTLATAGIGCFGELVVFLGIADTPVLRELQQQVTTAVEANGGVIDAYYRPGNWVPHCTLAQNVQRERFAATLEAASKFQLPHALPAGTLGIVRYPPTTLLWYCSQATPSACRANAAAERRDYRQAGIIGLKRHTVQVVEHRSEWAGLFRAEESRLREAVGDLVEEIQHVGSTAVPGLPAKPIIDVAIGVRSREVIPELADRLVARGYINRGEGVDSGGHLLVKEPEPDVRSFHVHIVETRDPKWRNYLAFRDRLRDDPSLRDRYAGLKQQLAAQFANDRKAYTLAKQDFIQQTLETP